MENKQNKQLIFGIGTGRCGTVSLFNLLNLQKNSKSTHESKPILPWNFSKKDIERKIYILLKRKEKFVSDEGFYYLPYTGFILSKYPSAKFIVLKRNKNEVIKSYSKKTEGRNHWINHDGSIWKKDKIWDPSYPKYNVKSKEVALEKYWDDYYTTVNKLTKKFPKNIQVWDMKKGLNTEDGVKEILSFAGIPEKDQIVKINIQENKIGVKKSFINRVLDRIKN
ncbi:hypothetical protein ACFL0X_00815 [Nanoarchaeota archaeon]